MVRLPAGWLALGLLAPALLNAQSASPAAAAGSTAVATYRNDALHLSYSYPAAYTDASGMVGAALQASLGQMLPGGKDESRCITMPFSAMGNTSGQIAVVLLVRADAACLKKSFTAADLPDFTQGEVQGLMASGAKTQFGEPVSYTEEGHPAELLRGTFTLPTGQALHSMVACVLLKPDVACWQFLGSSDGTLRSMSGYPVSLDGAPPAPLVPETLLEK